MDVSGKITKLAKQIDKLCDHKGSKHLINQFIGEYGEVVELDLDTKQKSLKAEIMLHGESNTVSVHVTDYAVTKAGGSAQFVIKKASVDRAWLNALMQKFVVDKSWEIPPVALPYLENFLV